MNTDPCSSVVSLLVAVLLRCGIRGQVFSVRFSLAAPNDSISRRSKEVIATMSGQAPLPSCHSMQRDIAPPSKRSSCVLHSKHGNERPGPELPSVTYSRLLEARRAGAAREERLHRAIGNCRLLVFVLGAAMA